MIKIETIHDTLTCKHYIRPATEEYTYEIAPISVDGMYIWNIDGLEFTVNGIPTGLELKQTGDEVIMIVHTIEKTLPPFLITDTFNVKLVINDTKEE